MPKQGKKKTGSGKKDDFNIQKGVDWTAKKEKQSMFTLGNFLTVAGILLGFLMLYLLVFVDETAAARERAEERAEAKREQLRKEYKPKEFVFEYTQEKDLEAMTQLLAEENDDEIKMIVFDYSEDPPERPGRGPIKAKYLWKRYERIAKSLRTKALFKRYDEEDLPPVIRFDCGDAGQLLCDKLVGDKAPATILLKNRRPRTIPDEVRSDKQVLQFLFDQMQPAVKYLETADDVEAFTESADEGLRVMFFGNERDPLAIFTGAADNFLRDVAKFGRTRDEEAIAKFADGATDVLVRLYRNFDDSPVDYTGELTQESIGDLVNFVKSESLPLFDEFSGKELRKYEKRGLPIVWVNVDSTEDGTERILAEGREVAAEFRGRFSFLYIDIAVNSEMQGKVGSDDAPQVVMKGAEEIKMMIDVDAPRTSLRAAVERYQAAAEGRANPVADDDEDDEDYYSDEDIEDDDEDLAGTEDAEDEAGDEEEEKDL